MPPQKSDLVLDVRGEMCPVPLVRTALALKRMTDGQTLAVTTDHVPSIQSIPDAVKKCGHEILRMEQLDTHTYWILIRK